MKKIQEEKNAFTLVELLAVIVILAIILVIAVPKVMSVIEDAKKATLESTAKMIASAAEKQKVQNTVLGNTKTITCESVAKINKLDYDSCNIEFENNIALVTIIGKGKFEGMAICKGTKTNSKVVDTCQQKKANITIQNVTGGTVTADKIEATAGETVTLTPIADDGYEYVGATVTYTDENGTSKTFALDADKLTFEMTAGGVTIMPSWEQDLVEQAIYSADDNSLTFVRREKLYTSGTDTFTDKNGKTKAVTAVYTGFGTDVYSAKTDVPWYVDGYSSNNITSVIFEDEIIPDSTAYWFYDCMQITYMDVEKLNTSKVSDMQYMFAFVGQNVSTLEIIGLENFITSEVENMSHMFNGFAYTISSYSMDLSGWDTSNVTDMSYMFGQTFYNATNFELDLSGWNVSNVTDMQYMFDGAGFYATTFAPDLSEWDFGNLSGWDTFKGINMSHMFFNAGGFGTNFEPVGLSEWDVSKVTNMYYMFGQAGYGGWSSDGITKLDLSKWNTGNVTNMASMFSGYGQNVKSRTAGDLSKWDVSKVTDMSCMFFQTGWVFGDIGKWDTSNVTDMRNMFYNTRHKSFDSESFELNLSEWDVSNVTNMDGMFYNAGYDSSTVKIDLTGWEPSAVTSMLEMFSRAGYNATSIELNLSEWNFSSNLKMNSMFFEVGKTSLIVKIDMSGWITSTVTSMRNMFDHAGYEAETFELVGLSEWDVSNVTHMGSMFYNAGYMADYYLDLSAWDINETTVTNNFRTGVVDKIYMSQDVVAYAAGTFPVGNGNTSHTLSTTMATAASLDLRPTLELPKEIDNGISYITNIFPNINEKEYYQIG